MGKPDVKPRYEVEAVDDEVTVTRYRRNENGMNEEYRETEPYGFNVYFPAGHSIRVATVEELHRLGFDAPAELIDMESGDTVASQGVSLKKHVQRRAGASKRADTGGTDANQGD